MTNSTDETTTVLEILAAHGGRGVVWVATNSGADESAFVLTSEGAARLLEGPAAHALTDLLHRKVFIGTRPPWPEETLQVLGTIAKTESS